MTSLEDIFVWADDSWMYREDYYDSIWKSDDYFVLEFGTAEYDRFLRGECMNYQQLGYKWLIGNFYYKHSNNLIDVYEYVDGVIWHRFQSVSYKESYESWGKILLDLIRERESE